MRRQNDRLRSTTALGLLALGLTVPPLAATFARGNAAPEWTPSAAVQLPLVLRAGAGQPPDPTPTATPQMRAVGWIGGGVDGWQTGDAPAADADERSFERPFNVFVADDGEIYVPDYLNHRIAKWSRDGRAMGWLGGGTDGWQRGDAPAAAADLHSFNLPRDVWLQGSDSILVLDRNNHRVVRWTQAGEAVGWIGGGADGWRTTDGAAAGSDHRSFRSPSGIACDAAGNIYVVDQYNQRVSKWTPDGEAVGWIGGGQDGWQTGEAPPPGADCRSFNFPHDIHVDTTGNIYVSDMLNHRVCKWDGEGTAIGWIGGGSDGWHTGEAPPPGADLRDFHQPFGLFAAADGGILVADFHNRRVVKWSVSGSAGGWIGGGADGWQTGPAPQSGTDYRSFYLPRDAFLDASGGIYVADGNRISLWRSVAPKGLP